MFRSPEIIRKIAAGAQMSSVPMAGKKQNGHYDAPENGTLYTQDCKDQPTQKTLYQPDHHRALDGST